MAPPLKLREACAELGVSRRHLVEHLRRNPQNCRRIGRCGDYRFDPEHIERLRVSLDERSGALPCPSNSSTAAASGTCAAPSAGPRGASIVVKRQSTYQLDRALAEQIRQAREAELVEELEMAARVWDLKLTSGAAHVCGVAR